MKARADGGLWTRMTDTDVSVWVVAGTLLWGRMFLRPLREEQGT